MPRRIELFIGLGLNYLLEFMSVQQKCKRVSQR